MTPDSGRQITRRDALRSLGLVGLGATAASGLVSAWPEEPWAASRSAPSPPPDIADGQGAWRMIGWGSNSGYPAMPEVDAARWAKRGFGGFKTSVAFLQNFGAGQSRFRGSSARREQDPALANQ